MTEELIECLHCFKMNPKGSTHTCVPHPATKKIAELQEELKLSQIAAKADGDYANELQAELNQLKSKTVNPVDFHRMEDELQKAKDKIIDMSDHDKSCCGERDVEIKRRAIAENLIVDLNNQIEALKISEGRLKQLLLMAKTLPEHTWTKKCDGKTVGVDCGCDQEGQVILEEIEKALAEKEGA